MNRRALVFAGLAAFLGAALALPVSGQRRLTTRREAATRRQPISATPAASHGDGLTASHVRTRIVTRTFTSAVPITIPATGTGPGPATPYPSTLRVHGIRRGRILTVRVRLIGLSHTNPGDLEVLLAAPGNATGVVLLSDALSTDVTDITLTFDQQAARRPPVPLVSGTFQPADDGGPLDPYPAPAGVPEHSLTVFNGRNPNGLWRLYVVDDGGGYFGALAGWSLTIRARIRVPHQHRRRGLERLTRHPKR